MKERIPSKLTLGDKQISFSEISAKFASTDWGKKLKGNIRWSKHKPKEVPDQDWLKTLGGDVNNLDHLVVTNGLTSSFLKGCETPGEEWKEKVTEDARFSAEEQGLLLLTATVHDWGEAIKGDISFYEKTEADNLEEMQELRIMLSEIFSEILGEKSNADVKKASDQVIDILTHTDSKLGKAFNAIERVGYVRTAIRAYDESERAMEDLKTPLKNMACRAVPDQVRVLLDYAKIYPPVLLYLRHHKTKIDRIFIDGENPEIHASIPKFEESKEKWKTSSI